MPNKSTSDSRTTHRQVSLKALMLLTAFVCIALYFVVAKKYTFPFEITASGNRIAFQADDIAAKAIGMQFTYDAAPAVVVECEVLQHETLDYLTDHEALVRITVKAAVREALPQALRGGAPRVPMSRNDFITGLEQQFEKRLGTDGCRATLLNLPLER